MDHLKSVDELCAEHAIEFEQLAAKAGLDEKCVQAIVEGRWTPSPAERDKIAAVFGLARDQIAWGHKSTVEHLQGHVLVLQLLDRDDVRLVDVGLFEVAAGEHVADLGHDVFL